MSRKIYTKYKDVVEYLGFKQLDVYRVESEGRTVDIIRIMDPMTGKVGVVNLGAAREALSMSEFLENVVKGAEEAGLPVNERRVATLKERFSNKP
ncbi:MAG: hypothetical protein F7C08_00195 [Desulfurococcales archaeon]|nr:hypothetical protein [Desulfurococcales archaeon]MCE4604948.1 hypothetical protein [Desulfurococcales archaeon]